jgi:membrane-bound serine protease (ClpP class)
MAHAESEKQVHTLALEGVVDPFEAGYITDGIADAGADPVLITIDTPGGLDSSMREITQAILGSSGPVICYVSPEGARAASAGAFILLSCDVAAMAPGTNVGAASPVGVSGTVERLKVLNDAAAYIRSLAEANDRNADWAERAVREAISASAEEALRLDVIDEISSTESELLADVDGQTIQKDGRSLVIDTDDAELVGRDIGVGSGLLHALFSPNFAFLFFYLGIGLIIVEVLHPGLSVPGVLGILFLVAALAAFGMLPVQLVGVMLLAASAAFALLELKHPGLSVAGIIGVGALIAGGLLLFDPSFPRVRVSPWLIVMVAGGMVLFFAFVIPAALRARRLPVTTGPERLMGAEGIATSKIDPLGTARVNSESWSVQSRSGPIERGERIRVVESDGVSLKVEAMPEISATEPQDLEHQGG